ncbi:reticulon-4 receptor [Erpetoichthys calabaricus]|uniref:Reticulon 4 receptor n=1 Tax=Erpetoichthys calabaricus TaxID=27687 RepID=A0A8C4TMQ3_ERPCA|nr:reticulon-4 receptor [Erpetoichthys calabaricus]
MKTSAVGGNSALFLLLWLNSLCQTESCPGVCVCYSEPKTTVGCQQQGLTSVPLEIPIRSQRIFLQNNRLTVVKSTSFSSCQNLTVLLLYSNNISYIEAGAFYGLEKLEELDIGENSNLRTISPTAFRGLLRLHTLHLNRCGLSELPVGIFHRLFSLQYLYIQNNNLQTLHNDTFVDLANLTYLFLHNNKIKALSENVFRGLTNLDRLLLHQNKVSDVHPRAFHDLKKLTTFYLFNNNLTELPKGTMDPLVSLQYLRLNGNQWICDCRALSLWDWFRQFKGSSSELECNLPLNLVGKDLKLLNRSDLDRCPDRSHHMQTSIFSTKTKLTKLPTTESPVRESYPKCCQSEMDKSSIIFSKEHVDPSSYNSRQITNNPLKEKENISKTKFQEMDHTKNSTHKQRLNDAPIGTYSSTLDQSLDKLKPEFIENMESSTAPTKKKKKCTKKPKSDSQCLKANNSTSVKPNLLVLPIIWIWLTMC